MSSLIEIQACSVSQHLPGTKDDIPLSDGPLALIQSSDKQLKLVCGTSAFSLDPKSPFYTNTESQRIYIFQPFLSATEKPGFYVKVLLPEAIQEDGSAAQKQRDEFEEILVQKGFLKEGIAAMAAEYGADVGDAVQAKKDQYLSSTEPGDVGQFSDLSHKIADRAVEYSHAAADLSAEFSKVVGKAAQTVGAKIAHLVSDKEGTSSTGEGGILSDPKVEATVDRVKQAGSQAATSISNVATGFAAGLTSMYTSATKATQEIIEHNFGPDAAQLSTQAGQTASNVGETAGNATLATSTMFHGGKVAEGAYKGEEKI